MSYDEDFVIDTDTEDDIDEDDSNTIDIEADKETAKQQRVSTRRRIEDILAEKRYKEIYGDIFDEF